MNRHQRRAAASKMGNNVSRAASNLQRAVTDLQSLEGLAQLPEALRHLEEGLQTMAETISVMSEELRVRREVLPKLLAELTGRSVAEVQAIEAKLVVQSATSDSAFEAFLDNLKKLPASADRSDDELAYLFPQSNEP
jgi:hypothetical protein